MHLCYKLTGYKVRPVEDWLDIWHALTDRGSGDILPCSQPPHCQAPTRLLDGAVTDDIDPVVADSQEALPAVLACLQLFGAFKTMDFGKNTVRRVRQLQDKLVMESAKGVTPASLALLFKTALFQLATGTEKLQGSENKLGPFVLEIWELARSIQGVRDTRRPRRQTKPLHPKNVPINSTPILTSGLRSSVSFSPVNTPSAGS